MLYRYDVTDEQWRLIRNLPERVIGWFKGCRALATRYDKLAVNYVAWLVANIHFLLRKRLNWLADGLSETT